MTFALASAFFSAYQCECNDPLPRSMYRFMINNPISTKQSESNAKSKHQFHVAWARQTMASIKKYFVNILDFREKTGTCHMQTVPLRDKIL